MNVEVYYIGILHIGCKLLTDLRNYKCKIPLWAVSRIKICMWYCWYLVFILLKLKKNQQHTVCKLFARGYFLNLTVTMDNASWQDLKLRGKSYGVCILGLYFGRQRTGWKYFSRMMKVYCFQTRVCARRACKQLMYPNQAVTFHIKCMEIVTVFDAVSQRTSDITARSSPEVSLCLCEWRKILRDSSAWWQCFISGL